MSEYAWRYPSHLDDKFHVIDAKKYGGMLRFANDLDHHNAKPFYTIEDNAWVLNFIATRTILPGQ